MKLYCIYIKFFVAEETSKAVFPIYIVIKSYK